MHPLLKKNHTGILLPLFSMRSQKDWGVGDIATLGLWLNACEKINLNLVQLLPVNEMPPGETCPYTALSAFAIDPLYIAVEEVPELNDCHEVKEEIYSKRFQTALKSLRCSKTVRYNEVKQLKFEVLWKIFSRFHENHISRRTPQAANFETFQQLNAYWLNDYAVFRCLKDNFKWVSWTDWPEPLKNRDTKAVKEFAAANPLQIQFFKYLQWVIDRQWRLAKTEALARHILLFGDLPFMVNQESADVWSRQSEFDIHKEIGAPPDAYSATGQKWGLPAYNWYEVEKKNFEWWRLKVKKSEDFYDMFRIDHMVGFFRTWVIPRNPHHKSDFDILDPHEQKERGRRFLTAISEASRLLPVAEDLGLIPHFVYETLHSMNIPGYKVMRWEKQSDGNYSAPEHYPGAALATSSTHDNEPLADWWTALSHAEKKLFWKMVSGTEENPPAYTKAREAILNKLLKTKAAIVILPIQDIFGHTDRINEPGTVSSANWTYKFPTPVEELFNKHGEILENFSIMVRERQK